MDRCIKTVRDFLHKRLTPGRKLFLALSGGNDSLALLNILITCRHFLHFELHIAHVDHAWRQESAQEATDLMRLAKDLKVPFHYRRLKSLTGSNIEDRYREERYQFFFQLQKELNFQAILLAHHADDQAETLLKRICEGARLKALVGIQYETKIDNLTLWRPLLSIRKEELTQLLKIRGIKPFDDSTNRNIHYLRPRMRLKIFPQIEKNFGKKIGRNFQKLNLLFQEMKDYLGEKSKEIEKMLVQGPFGAYLKDPADYARLEMRYFLEEKAHRIGAHLSYSSCSNLLTLIENRSPKATIHAGHLSYIINKDILFFLDKDFPSFSWDQWDQKEGRLTWKSFWKGICPIFPPNAKALLLDELNPTLRKKVKKWYTSNGVPSFFHEKAPVFCVKGKIIGECLTGKIYKYL